MHRIFTFLAGLVLATAAQAACTTTDLIAEMPAERRAELAARVDSHPYPRGNFWRATRDDVVFHIAGSMHLFDPRHEILAGRIEGYFDAVDRVYLETTKVDQKVLERRLVETPEIGFFVTGPTLIDRMPPETWAALAEAMRARGMPAWFASKLRPWYAATFLQFPPCLVSALQADKPGLDALVETRAEAAGLPIRALDDAEAMLALLADRPIEVQLEELTALLAFEDRADAMYSTLAEAYFRGEHRALIEFSDMLLDEVPGGLSESASASFETLMAGLLTERNMRWVAELSAVPGGTRAIVVIGAGHLSGADGVLALLEAEGFSISPL